MKYIPLDEVKEILNTYSKWPLSMQNHLDMFDKFNSIKSIDLSIIDEMIEEKVYRHNYSLIDDTETDELSWAIKALKELKERLSLNE